MYKVILYFDNMIDDEYTFEKEGDAAHCFAQLKKRYQGKRLYRVEKTNEI